MRNFFILFILIIFFFLGVAQEQIKAYTEKNLKIIKSIQPDYTDNSDLEVISKAIGDSRVVMLGEQSHNDASTFLAKTRIIKYLHENKGFNILAFEGDFFALNQGYEKNKDAMALKYFMNKNIYTVWSKCKECDQLLYEYIPQTQKTESPLKVAGFDNQMGGRYTRATLKEFLRNYLEGNKIKFINSKEYKSFFLPFLDTLLVPGHFDKNNKDFISNPQSKLKRFALALDTILEDISNKNQQQYPALVIQNLKVLTNQLAFISENTITGSAIRDAQMAKNLAWLVRKKYPKEKIIVWAANRHIGKGEIKDYSYNNKEQPIDWMGSLFTKDPINNNQTYILGFDSKYGNNNNVSNVPTGDTFEAWIDEAIPYGFVDFKALKKQNENYSEFFSMKAFGHSHIYANWTNIFDGIFYIRDMTKCEESEFDMGKTK